MSAPEHTSKDRADYRESADISEVHAAIKREHQEPEARSMPVPAWLLVVSAVAGAFAFTYLGLFHGGFSGDVFNEWDSSPRLLFSESTKTAGAASNEAAKEETLAEQGKKVFSGNCVTCHQTTGLGVPGSFPPLAGSEFVLGSPKRLTMIVLKGLQGPVEVKGAKFNGAMPPWEKTFTDKKIAAVLTYIRQEWGNKAPEITPDQVAAARKEFASRTEPWTAADILAVPADATLPGGSAAPAAAAPAAAAGTPATGATPAAAAPAAPPAK
jgi:mono/diheme cytochrome c family protein